MQRASAGCCYQIDTVIANMGRKAYHIAMETSKRTRKSDLEALGDIAELQEGYFSAADAALVGIDRHRLQRLVGQGIIKRDERGIYRLARYPHGDRAELWRAVLWPSRRGGILGTLSHGTALSLYEVSTINPSQIDIILPRALRIRRAIPREYRLRSGDYADSDMTRLFGLPVTTLYRTIFDLIVDSSESQFVAEALDNGQRRGVLTTKETQRLRALRELGSDMIEKIVASKAGAQS